MESRSKKEKLIDCDFEAWIHGPVCPKLYQKYRDFGWDLIAQKKVMK